MKPDVPDFRAVICDRLEQMQKSRLWLARNQSCMSPGAAAQFLYSKRDRSLRLDTLVGLLAALDLELSVVPKAGSEPVRPRGRRRRG